MALPPKRPCSPLEWSHNVTGNPTLVYITIWTTELDSLGQSSLHFPLLDATLDHPSDEMER